MTSTAALAPGPKRQSILVASGSTPGSPKGKEAEGTTTTAATATLNAKNVTSPGELCGFVDTLLNTLEGRFDEMSDQMMTRMDEMASRIDNLETAISDLMNSGSAESPTATPTKSK